MYSVVEHGYYRAGLFADEHSPLTPLGPQFKSFHQTGAQREQGGSHLLALPDLPSTCFPRNIRGGEMP